MKAKLSIIAVLMVVFAMVFASAAIAQEGYHGGHGGDRHGGGDHHGGSDRHGGSEQHGWGGHRDHHDRIDRPIATLALCILYPAMCRPHPVIIQQHPVVIVKQPVVVPYPETGNSVDIEINGGLSKYSGSWWNGLPEHSKLNFVSVYVRNHKGQDAALYQGKSYGEIVRGLNMFYQTGENYNLSVDMALDIVTLRLNGYSEFADCMNGYYIMSNSPRLFQPDMVNAKFNECQAYAQPTIY